VLLLLSGTGLAFSPPAPAAEPQSTEATDSGCGAEPAYVMLDGRRVVELRAVPGAQDLRKAAERESEELLELAQRQTLKVDQIRLQETPPFTLIGIETAEGSFERIGAVDERMAGCFDLPRKELAARYRDQISTAISRYREAHSVESCLRGTALAGGVP
jgi:hypothetical protein